MNDLLFGVFVPPKAAQARAVTAMAHRADALGIDLFAVQDHPYNSEFLDTWTLLSTLAERTERIRLVPDVLNLPLRPPAVLARSAATLDLLTDGRVELGLGAGAFWDGIAAMGGPRRTPREAVQSLEEAIGVLRALWSPVKRRTQLEGEFYGLTGARPGPPPAHDIGIWVGALGPRMLDLIGRLADGWLPSSFYLPPDGLAAGNARIDAAAEAAGREPSEIRRLYNIAGSFGDGTDFLTGPPDAWVEQLIELAVEQRISAFILAVDPDQSTLMERFAAEVVPAVREAVEGERDPAPAGGGTDSEGEPRLDPAGRPRLARQESGAEPTVAGRQSADLLVQVHDQLREELTRMRELVGQLAAGSTDIGTVRSEIGRLTMRQNYFSVGAFCASYCRAVAIHHTIEDQRLFPDLRAKDGDLSPVLDRLSAEHHAIAGVLDALDEALVGLSSDPARMPDVVRLADRLGDDLLSHLAYEEEELLGPIARLGIQV